MNPDSRLAAAMVLAAGRGRRMQPLSDAVPKPALPVLDRPLVAWAVDQAFSAGSPFVVVNAWHLADRMGAAVRALPQRDRIMLSVEERLMDTAGGLALARDRGLLGDRGPVLVLNGDGLYGLDLKPLLDEHRRRGWSVSLGLLPHLDPRRWSRVELDADSRVVALRPPGKPEAGEVPFLYPGAMVLSRQALEAVPSEPCGIPENVWDPAIARGELGGIVVSGHWSELGSPEAYRRSVLSRVVSSPWIDQTARVDPRASLGPAVIGPNAVVERGAVVAGSIVTHGAVIRREARVIESVLVGRAEASSGESITNGARAVWPVW